MKRFLVALVAVAAAASTYAADGAAVYASKCKMCHGPNGEGTKMGVAIAGKSAGDVKTAVTQGKGKMKPVKTVEGADLDAVAAYVSGLKK